MSGLPTASKLGGSNYNHYRFHETTSASNLVGSSQEDDGARLRCHSCNVVRELFWDKATKMFQLRVPGSNAEDSNKNLHDLCHGSTSSNTVCEYSSGTCFIEERRVWGYVTQVRAGCKQAQACYMQKYQNFLVKAGRQCWPGTETGMLDKIAKRPYDLMSDQWVHKIVQGGFTNHGATGASFAGGGAAASPFDVTFTDTNGLENHGFYVTGGARSNGIGSNSNLFKMSDPVNLSYQNGLVPTSKCYQCCNTDHNCNHKWQPLTEADWEAAFVFGYKAGSGAFSVAHNVANIPTATTGR